jgi:RNA polymerase sigma-70 factor (ECF subfamily)
VDTERLVAEHRGHLFGIAYRMLGQVGEAEDAVQEAFLRWTQADRSDIENPAAWLTTVVTRVCLDRLKSAQRQREAYVGPWLPEPLMADDVDPADIAGTTDTLTFAFLVVLERLSPAERAAFLLHDVFGYDHAEVAAMLERSPAAVRQLAARARDHLADQRPRYEQDAARRRQVAEAFSAAAVGGDMEQLMKVLAPDVRFVADGGGVVAAPREPLHGVRQVATLVLGFARLATSDHQVTVSQINGMPGFVIWYRDRVDSVWTLQIVDDHVAGIHAVRNPAKLASVGHRGRQSSSLATADRSATKSS